MKTIMNKASFAFLLTAGLAALPIQPLQAAQYIELSPQAQADQASGIFKALDQIETILEDVSQLRHLAIKRPVKLSTIDRKQLSQELEKQVATEIPAEKIEAEEALYQQLGMLSPDFDYRQFLLDLYTEQIGGFYDPKTGDLKLIKGTPLTGIDQQLLIAHELTHALQDQHFELKRLTQPDGDNDDQTLAHMALIEGDATITAGEYIQQQLSKRPAFGLFDVFGSVMNLMKGGQSFNKFSSAPAFIRNSLIFPYDQGAQFISSFRKRGWSWSKMAEFYERPPRSTEHILHPATYLAQKSPVTVDLSLQAALPTSKVLSANTWGELSYQQYLAHYLDWRIAKKAAQGWQGDHYEVLQSSDGKVFGFYSLWDSPAEAQEFSDAYAQTLAKRYPDLKADAHLGGQSLTLASKRSIWWKQTQAGVLIVENLAAGDQAALQALIKQWPPAVSTRTPN